MKKIILPTLIIILSGFVFSACAKTGDQTTVTGDQATVTEQKQEQDGSFSGTIKDLMGINKTQKCMWSETDQGKGIVYVSGKKTRSEITIVEMEDQPAQQMFNISDGEWAYSWNPATKKGMKVKIEEINEEIADEEEYNYEEGMENDYQEITNQDYKFKCENWKADSKMFVPPTDVEFVDMNAMMENMQQNMEGMKKMCDMMSGEDKAECLAGFEK